MERVNNEHSEVKAKNREHSCQSVQESTAIKDYFSGRKVTGSQSVLFFSLVLVDALFLNKYKYAE